MYAMRPVTIPKYISKHNLSKEVILDKVQDIKKGLNRLRSSHPDVSIIIPAYNEEESILKTLSSIAASDTRHSVEVILVDNNSADKTAELAEASGCLCIPEYQQGVTPARNTGLKVAKGSIILNADADTIYPPQWINLMVAPLEKQDIALVYGTFAFIPTAGTPRLVYFGYEHLSDLTKWVNKTFKEEAVNVYGFNSAFRRLEGLEVGSFDHPPGTNEDGWLAVKLRSHHKKRLYHMQTPQGMVWTSDRRIQMDGGLLKGIRKRIIRELGST
jgi:glycosyltransferase involved in cell wall biosynthesis